MRESAGLLLYRLREGRPQVLLVHPGGPFWSRRDERAWSIPKGECGPREDHLAVALREFEEELGQPAAVESLIRLGTVRQPGGKVVHAWAAAGDFDPAHLTSNTFQLEWPPRSGRVDTFPEIDRAGWFDIETARRKLLKPQQAFLDRLLTTLSG